MPDGVTAQVRRDDETRYVFLMNFNREPRSVELGTNGLTDLLNGEAAPETVELDGYGIRVLAEQVNAG